MTPLENSVGRTEKPERREERAKRKKQRNLSLLRHDIVKVFSLRALKFKALDKKHVYFLPRRRPFTLFFDSAFFDCELLWRGGTLVLLFPSSCLPTPIFPQDLKNNPPLLSPFSSSLAPATLHLLQPPKSHRPNTPLVSRSRERKEEGRTQAIVP